MSELINNVSFKNEGNILSFPTPEGFKKILTLQESTPVYDKLLADAEKLDRSSSYKSEFDYSIYKNLELRYKDKPIHGGVVMRTVFRLANSHSTCQQCLYTFEIDTYGRGCIHNCAYCYAKAELTVHGMWNNPIPVPVDINQIRLEFYKAFETDRKGKWADLLRRRIPLRIGSMSDSFMWMDQKYRVTLELLKILKHYNYPYVVFTRSDLVATDEYLKVLDPKLCSVQFSLSSINDDLIRKMEPGAPSSKRRLKALQKLAEAGFWTTVRINPLFPIYPDGYYSNPDFSWNGPVPKFDFSSFEMVDVIAAHKVPSILAGFGRFSKISMNALEKAVEFDLRKFFQDHGSRGDLTWRDYRYSDAEIRCYYEEFKRRAEKNKIQFTTCYIGNGEAQFWRDQDLWSNKSDCCNVKKRVDAFKTDAREIPFEQRLKFTNHKETKPTSSRLHEPLAENKFAVASRRDEDLHL